MARYTLAWADARRTALYLRLNPAWDWPDLLPAAAETAALLDQVAHRVDFVVHVPDRHPSPASALPMFDAIAAMPAFTHPNAGRTVVVAADAHLASLLTLFRFTYPGPGQHVLLVDSLAAARAVLQVLNTTGSLGAAGALPSIPPYAG